MEIHLSPEELERIKNTDGKLRGFSFQIVKDFIHRKKGQEGVEKLTKAMVEIGYPVHFEKISAMKFYPLSSFIALFLVVQKIFDFQDKDFEEFGRFRAKSSFFVRLYMKYFVSLDKLVQEAPETWRKSTTVGDLEVAEYNKEKKQIRIRIKGYNTTPKQCIFFKGLFSETFKNVLGKEPTCEETKCVYKGDDYHEFLVRW